jgi:hypothetical protein
MLEDGMVVLSGRNPMGAQVEFAPPVSCGYPTHPLTGQETLAVAFDPAEQTLADDSGRTGGADFFEDSVAGRLIGGALFTVAMLCYLVAYTTKVFVCLLFRSRSERFA